MNIKLIFFDSLILSYFTMRDGIALNTYIVHTNFHEVILPIWMLEAQLGEKNSKVKV